MPYRAEHCKHFSRPVGAFGMTTSGTLRSYSRRRQRFFNAWQAIDMGTPSRAFPVAPPDIRVRTTVARLGKPFTVVSVQQDPMSESEHLEKLSSMQGSGSHAMGREHYPPARAEYRSRPETALRLVSGWASAPQGRPASWASIQAVRLESQSLRWSISP